MNFLFHNFLIAFFTFSFLSVQIRRLNKAFPIDRCHLVHAEGGCRVCLYKYIRTKEHDDHYDVGGTVGEGFSYSFSTVVSQRMQDDNTGEHHHDKTHCTNGPTVGHQESIDHVGVCTGKFQQRLQVTEIVINHIGTTKR